MQDSNADEYDIKKHKEFVDETAGTLKTCKEKFLESMEELRSIVVRTSRNARHFPSACD